MSGPTIATVLSVMMIFDITDLTGRFSAASLSSRLDGTMG
jgi:hypothetical protein